MHGFRVFLGKEFHEIIRTWRAWVLPGIMVFIGATSPLIALVTPDLVASLAPAEQTGLVIQIPDPVTADAYLQFVKNATQMALIAVIIAAAGMIAAEKKSGTAILVLTKPLSRTSMVIAKTISNWALLLVATLVGAGLCVAVTVMTFDSGLISEFVLAALAWFALAAMFVTFMAFFSVLVGSQGGAAGAGIGLYLILSIVSAWGPAREYSPAGLISAGGELITGKEPALFWPFLSAAIVSILVIAVTSLLFERQEL